MSLYDKNIIISPGIGATTDPTIYFVSADANTGPSTITASISTTTSGTLSFQGSAGNLFSISNSLSSGSIFNVNTISGLPVVDVNADRTVSLNVFGGNTGIGTTTPRSKLTVYGDGYFTGILTAQFLYGDGSKLSGINANGVGLATNNTDANQLITYAVSTASTVLGVTTNFVFNPATTKLGIGTSNPLGTLHVEDNLIISAVGAAATQVVQIRGYTQQSGLLSFEDINRNQQFNISNDTSNLFYINDYNANTKFIVNTSGNIGIGTTVASSPLHVGTIDSRFDGGIFPAPQASTPLTQLSQIRGYSNNSGTFSVEDYYRNQQFNVSGDTSNVFTINDYNAYPRLNVNNNGNIGIGTTVATSSLHVSNIISRFDGPIVPSQIGLSTTQVLQIRGYSSSSGAISIEDSSRNQLFSVSADTSNLFVVNDSNAVAALIVDNSGNLYVKGDITAFYVPSDKNWKDNISPILNSLEKVVSISGNTFEWNEKSTQVGKDVGVIAQEIEQVLPEAVTQRADGHLSVAYHKLIPLLIESIKELKLELDDLKKSINK